MIYKNNLPPITVLAEIYDKHAGIMYGCIYKLIEKQDTSEKILKQIFVDLYKEKEKFLKDNDSLWYAKLALQTTVAFLRKNVGKENIQMPIIRQMTIR